MKKFLLLTLTLFLFIGLCGCSADSGITQNGESDIKIDAYEAKIAYCMELIESLKSELGAARQEAYISCAEYERQIHELNARIASLLESAGTDGAELPTDTETVTDLPEQDSLDFEYVKANGGIRITKYTGSKTDIEIPQSIDGLTVTELGENAFFNTEVTSVRVPDGVKLLDWFVFYSCTSLKTVILPASVTSIEYGAFDYTHPALCIICPYGSYAEAYAKSWGFDCVVE